MSEALRVLAAVFDIDSKAAQGKVEKLNETIETAKTGLGAMASSLVASFSIGAISHFIQEQIELGSKINDTAEKLGVGTDELQKFQYAAGLSGVEAESAGMALGFLNKNMGEALGGSKEAVQTFAELKVALKDGKGNVRELGDVIPELADAFAEMNSDQERTTAAMKIFGKSGAQLLPLLKKGSEELATLGKEFDDLGGGIEKEAIEKFDEAGDEIDRFKFGLTGLKSRIAVQFLPAVVDVARRLQGLAVDAQKLTKNTYVVQEAMAVMGVVAAAAGLKAAAGWAKFLGVVPKDANFLESIFKMGTIGLLIAGVLLLFLVFEDLFNFLAGNESVIGDLITKFLGVEEANALTQAFRQTWDDLAKTFEADFAAFQPLLGLFDGFGSTVGPRVVATLADWLRIGGALLATFIALGKVMLQLSVGDFKGAVETIKKTGSSLFGDGGLLSQSALGNLQLREDAAATQRPELPYADRNVGGRVEVNRGDTVINVNGTGDPGAVANRVAGFQKGLATADVQNAAAALGVRGGDE